MSRPLAGPPISASEVIAALETILAAEQSPQLAGLAVIALPGHVVGRAGLVDAHLTIARGLREMDAVIAAKPERGLWSVAELALSVALATSDPGDRLQVAQMHEEAARVLCGGGTAS